MSGLGVGNRGWRGAVEPVMPKDSAALPFILLSLCPNYFSIYNGYKHCFVFFREIFLEYHNIR